MRKLCDNSSIGKATAMNRLFAFVAFVLGFFNFTACDGPLSCEGQWEICKQFGVMPEEPPAPPTAAPTLPPAPPTPPTPQEHCGEPEGFHAPANGRECEDGIDNDCDRLGDTADPDCVSNICSPNLGSRCRVGTHCDIAEWKCVPDPPPPAQVDCPDPDHQQLCDRCPLNQHSNQICIVINGVPELWDDTDIDGTPDRLDDCGWYNPGGVICPEGNIDNDGDFVPDEVDSCPRVANAGDPEGDFCARHPEVNCAEVLPEYEGQMAFNQDWAWCEHFITGVNFPVRLCEVDWVVPLPGQAWDDLCLGCSNTPVPDGFTCTLQNGWFPQIALDSDADGYPDEYPGSEGETIFLDNCPNFANPDQVDLDQDGIGDACTL